MHGQDLPINSACVLYRSGTYAQINSPNIFFGAPSVIYAQINSPKQFFPACIGFVDNGKLSRVVEDVGFLHNVVSDLGRLKACLPLATVSVLQDAYVTKLKQIWPALQQVLAGKLQKAQAMTKVLQETSTVFPLDAEVQTMLLDCGSLLTCGRRRPCRH